MKTQQFAILCLGEATKVPDIEVLKNLFLAHLEFKICLQICIR